MRALLLPVTALWLFSVVEAGAALPARLGQPSTPFALVQASGDDVGPAAAAAAARNATGGRVLGVTGRRAGDRVIYRVRVLLPGGRVRTVTVDGASGQVQG